ncbi:MULTISPECIES: type III secretion system translocon subunit SctE [Pseudomonas]|uniref:type III secretion system translocon subunit SctE n=1 Tax=Pseudomonas TaxID=286 RepID=UPI001BEA80C0|nr:MULTISPECIES: type III secretion system translocon subunit SctE [Pseudomonas]MBT2339705.1 type III secretion system translocon subunit SctE [Pseudomonas fluorescens]MCD4531227.1 type III secretion system translocon subunit SctE [Pseudomonas sp. C3-2018]
MSEITRPAYPGATTNRAEAFERYDDAASKAARTTQYREAGQKALEALMSVRYDGRGAPSTASPGRPVLHPPLQADGNRQEANGDLFTLLMAMISELIGEVDVNKLKNRLAMLQSMASARQQGLENLSAEYAAALQAWEAAEGQVGGSQEHLEQLHERVMHFQGLLAQSEARLAQLDPESPEYAEELTRRDQLKSELAGHTQAFNAATVAHLKLIEVANAVAKALAEVVAKVRFSAVSSQAVKETDEKALSSSALALLNRLKIIELLGEAAQNKEELSQELFQELQAKLQEHMKRESDKYLEEVRKAEALQKTMGCIGKIVGAIVAAVTIVAGVMTANLPLIVVGVVGIAVMIADVAVEAKTGKSFMAEAMKPLTIVMQEAIKRFSEIYTQLLIDFGVDPEKAKDIAQIAGMIQGVISTLAAVALVAMVGAQVIGPMISAVASKLASVAAQAAPGAMQVMKQMASSIGNTLTQALAQLRGFITHGADPVSLARYAANLEIAQAVTEFGNVVVQGGLQIQSGKHQAQAAVHLADVRVRMAISEEISRYLTQLVEDYGQAMQYRTRQIEQVFADLQRSHAVSLQMVRHV